MKKFAFFLIMIFTSNMALSSHVMGGELTWRCGAGGVYTFELVFYRDCNGAEFGGKADDCTEGDTELETRNCNENSKLFHFNHCTMGKL